MELTIDLKKLKESGLFVEDFFALTLINSGENPKEYLMNDPHSLRLLEDEMWIKSTEEGYELRSKGRALFEQSSNTDCITEIIEYLNLKTGKKFSIKAKANRDFINARLKEKYTIEDLKKVIDTMVSKWLNDPKMSMYLRPETLFNATKFQTYINLVAKEEKDWTVQRA